jgi:DNA-binding transcriptional ArsR family regulator
VSTGWWLVAVLAAYTAGWMARGAIDRRILEHLLKILRALASKPDQTRLDLFMKVGRYSAVDAHLALLERYGLVASSPGRGPYPPARLYRLAIPTQEVTDDQR